MHPADTAERFRKAFPAVSGNPFPVIIWGVFPETRKRPFTSDLVSGNAFRKADVSGHSRKRPFSRFPVIIPYGEDRPWRKRPPLGDGAALLERAA